MVVEWNLHYARMCLVRESRSQVMAVDGMSVAGL